MKISDFIKLSELSVSSELWTAEMSFKMQKWGWYTFGTTECTFNLKTQKGFRDYVLQNSGASSQLISVWNAGNKINT